MKRRRDREGRVERYKVRLVIRGFEQREGIDYNETFASISKSPTWRVLLPIAASLDWEIDQVDIVAAFLNGNLEERVQVHLPDGLDDLFAANSSENDIGFEPKVAKVLAVHKSLYGLKQAPRQW